MADMRQTTEPKSDQLNADSLIGGKSLTIKITKVSVLVGGEQPVTVNYVDDNGRPYKPGKSMRRVMVNVWGPDSANYIGRSMTLYCDEKVQFGGMAVGGIRISHMSHIDAPITMALTTTRSKRAPFTVKPLKGADDAPAKINRDQQKEIVAAMGDQVKPADLLAKFNVKSSGEILASQLAEVLAWVQTEKEKNAGGDFCPKCLTEGGHSASCPDAQPPADL
jgi:hypothetical protein